MLFIMTRTILERVYEISEKQADIVITLHILSRMQVNRNIK